MRFLEALIAAVPYRLHTVLTDNGIQFADLPKNRDGWTARYRVHRFDQICRASGIEHRLTKPNHPWTNGQVGTASLLNVGSGRSEGRSGSPDAGLTLTALRRKLPFDTARLNGKDAPIAAVRRNQE